MRIWPVRHVKARFGEFLEACRAEEPQLVTCNGIGAAVLVPAAQWRRMQSEHSSLEQWLPVDQARTESSVAPGKALLRGVDGHTVLERPVLDPIATLRR